MRFFSQKIFWRRNNSRNHQQTTRKESSARPKKTNLYHSEQLRRRVSMELENAQ